MAFLSRIPTLKGIVDKPKPTHMRIITLLLLLLSIFSQAIAQNDTTAMKKLEFLTGDWKGTGWYKMQESGDSLTFSQKGEWINSGKVLHVSASFQLYASGDLTETVVDVTYDEKQKKYLVTAQAGTQEKSNGEGLLVDDHTFQYTLTFGTGWKMRYSFSVTGSQQIVRGESSNANDSWMQIFGGTINK